MSEAQRTEAESYQYDAFISYRHVEPDRGWAKWLHGALETYRVPKELVAKGFPRRLTRVFRDEEELPANADLSTQITSALDQSRFLIVVCSPRAVESRWVNAEVEHFRKLGRHDRILALLIEGEPRTSFPKALVEIRRTVVDHAADGTATTREVIEEVEPLAADVRLDRTDTKAHVLRGHARLRLMACILGCRFDDLRQRDAERRARRARLIGTGLVSLVLVLTFLTGFAFVQRERAVAGEREAQRQSEMASRNAEEARRNADAAEKSAIEARAQEKIAKDQEAEAVRQAKLAEDRRAEADAARKAETEAKQLSEKRREEAEKAQVQEAEARKKADQERARAERRFEQTRAIANEVLFSFDEPLSKLAGGTPLRETMVATAVKYLEDLRADAAGMAALRHEIATGYVRTGSVQLDLNKSEAALASYGKAIEMCRELIADGVAESPVKWTLAGSLQFSAVVLERQGKPNEAKTALEEAIAVAEAHLAQLPDDQKWRGLLETLKRTLGSLQINTGQRTEGAAGIQEALRSAREAAAARPDDRRARDRLASALQDAATEAAAGQRLDEAVALQRECCVIREALAAEMPDDALTVNVTCESAATLALYLRMTRRQDEALEVLKAASPRINVLVDKDPRNVGYLSTKLYLQTGLLFGYLDLRKPTEAAALSAELHRTLERVRAEDPRNYQARQQVLNALRATANATEALEANERALASWGLVIAEIESMGREFPDAEGSLNTELMLEARLRVTELLANSGKAEEALAALENVLVELRSTSAPRLSDEREKMLVNALTQVWNLSNDRDPKRAEAVFAELIAAGRASVARRPDHPGPSLRLINILRREALARQRTVSAAFWENRLDDISGVLAQMTAPLDEALGIATEMQRRGMDDSVLRVSIVRVLVSKVDALILAAPCYSRLKQDAAATAAGEKAIAAADEAMELAQALVAAEPDSRQNLELLVEAQRARGGSSRSLLRLTEAASAYRECVRLWREIRERNPADVDARHDLGAEIFNLADVLWLSHHHKQARGEAAATAVEEAKTLFEEHRSIMQGILDAGVMGQARVNQETIIKVDQRIAECEATLKKLRRR